MTHQNIQAHAGDNTSLILPANMAINLQKSELQSQFEVAKSYQRALNQVQTRILSLAMLDQESADEYIYALRRGGEMITGPSIRFAEIIKAAYGNCRVAARVIDVNRKEGYLEAEGIFHDLETNAIEIERVRRSIKTKNGGVYSDDMINITSNAACSVARRNAILKSIPKPLWNKTYETIEQKVKKDLKNLNKARQKAVTALSSVGLSKEEILQILDIKSMNDITVKHVKLLRGIYAGLRNGEMTLADILEEKYTAPLAAEGAKPTQPLLKGALDD